MESQVERFINDIVKLHDSLSTTSDLRPSELVNGLFEELVTLCTQTLSTSATKKILEDQRVQDVTASLRQLCATAESYLESHWAIHIAGLAENEGVDASRRLSEFPYYENYIDLTRLELSAIQAVKVTTLRRIAFIGSGPLPLTSLCLCQARDKSHLTKSIKVLNIDNNAQAIMQSQALVQSLGPVAGSMDFLCKDAISSDLDLSGFDVVYLAALVGLTQAEKEDVLAAVVRKMSFGDLVVIRSAYGLRSLLYPEFDATTEAVLAYLEICLVVHPYNHVVNSVIIGRVKPRVRSGPRL